MKPLTRQAGLSLIELMIAVTIGLLLLAGVVTIVINGSRTQNELEKIGRQIENGRYAVEIMQREIPHAGYYGEFFDIAAPGSIPDPCSTSVANIGTAMRMPIQGYDSPTGDPTLTCLSDAQHADGTDILVIRRASTVTEAIDTLAANELYLQSVSIEHILAQASGGETAGAPGAFTLQKRDNTPASLRRLRTDIYFIGPDADDVPTLRKLALSADGSGNLVFADRPLVSGIENLQVDYGVDGDGDGIPEQPFVNIPSSVDAWADVVAVRIHLIARNVKPTPGYTDVKTYDVGLDAASGGTVGPMNDSYRRRAYVATIRAINPSIRRE